MSMLQRLVMTVVLLAVVSSAHAKPPMREFFIPRLDNLTIDGNASDWGDAGFQVNVMVPRKEKAVAQSDFDPRLRLAWNDKGLLVAAIVTDDLAAESPEEAPWAWDSVEFFLAGGWESKQYYQLIITPGIDAEAGGFKLDVHDKRDDKTIPIKAEAKATQTKSGYILEALLPWDAIGVSPAKGVKVAFNAQVNDRDLRSGGKRYETTWFPAGWAGNGPQHMYRLHLSDQRSGAFNHAATHRLSQSMASVRVTAISAFPMKQKLVATSRGEEIASTGTTSRSASMVIPVTRVPVGQVVSIRYGNGILHEFAMPDTVDKRRQEVLHARLHVHPIFDGEGFPGITFETPGWIETLLGEYTVTTTHYNGQLEKVEKPTKPGRYIAHMHITAEGIEPIDRFVTVCRVKKIVDDWTPHGDWATLALPKQYGFDPAVLTEQRKVMNSYAQWRMADELEHEAHGAELVAALLETKPGADTMDGWDAGLLSEETIFKLEKKLGLVEHRYITNLPADYEADKVKRWPLIIFLHGSGERGTDIKRVGKHGPPMLARKGKLQQFIVISPQCDPGKWWTPFKVIDILDEVLAKYRIDADRVYLTGLSMGGYGTWHTASYAPERFAAAAPICGGGPPHKAHRMKGVPTWCFHGDADKAVPISRSDEMVNALTKAGGKVKYTVYPGVGHDSWTESYDNDLLYQWFLANKRGAPIVMPDELE